ncbi:MAG: hypothetical protein MUE40_09660 [Anaerolineae bacterium]|jgi:hypothetical protein|nr:hypothetical protein [Anaerolineae bacterium]
MPVTVYRLENEPILIATFTGEVNGDVIVEMFRRSDALLRDDDALVYRVSDFRQATTSALAVLTILKAVVVGGPGSPRDPRIKGVMLGDNQWVKVGQDTLKNPAFGGMNIPLFARMGDAMTHIRVQIARSHSGV